MSDKDSVIIPARFHGILPGPDLKNCQRLVTLHVELEDGTHLRVAFPKIALLTEGVCVELQS